MFPLNGWRVRGSSPSRITRSTGSTPSYSRLARVVSKCVLDGTTSPGRVATEKRIRSAARPWCVGMTNG